MVLLTGGAGFLGKFVLDELLEQGFEVIALTRSKSGITKSYPLVQWIKGDLGNPKTLKKLPSPTSGIIHLASTLSLQPKIVMDTDVKGMWSLLDIWDKESFIYCSSTDVYGPLQDVPATEEHPLAPSNWYGFGKLVCEQQLRLAARMESKDEAIVFRAPYILGPHPKFKMSLIGKLIEHSMRGGDFILSKMENAGHSAFGHSWVNARDIARWIVSALRGVPPGAYNAANGFFTWEELVELIIELTHSASRILYGNNDDLTPGLYAEERRFTTDKLKQAYNIQYTKSLREILIEIISEMDSQMTGTLQKYLG